MERPKQRKENRRQKCSKKAQIKKSASQFGRPTSRVLMLCVLTHSRSVTALCGARLHRSHCWQLCVSCRDNSIRIFAFICFLTIVDCNQIKMSNLFIVFAEWAAWFCVQQLLVHTELSSPSPCSSSRDRSCVCDGRESGVGKEDRPGQRQGSGSDRRQWPGKEGVCERGVCWFSASSPSS